MAGAFRQTLAEGAIRPLFRPTVLGWHMPRVDRLFDLNHASRFDQIEAAARALGRHIEVRVT